MQKKKYWDINKILPYQRCFNFINGKRSIGKTYTTQKYILTKALENYQFDPQEFIFLVRTQDEKRQGALEDFFKKVTIQEFPNYTFRATTDHFYLVILDEDGEVLEKHVLGYCYALSEAVKIKKKSFPLVKYMIFDEYMLETKQGSQYINGWKEPDLLLSIYHTVDREQDKVICFLLGNNTQFYNPYHMHPAFNIPEIKKGQIWTSENVLFQWAEGSDELNEQKENCKFLKMISNTNYGEYAKEGNYVGDNTSFIEPITGTARYNMTLEYNGENFGVYSDIKAGKIFISDKVDSSCKMVYALTLDDHKENTMLTKGNLTQLMWLAHNFKIGNVRFVSMPVKTKIEHGIALLL